MKLRAILGVVGVSYLFGCEADLAPQLVKHDLLLAEMRQQIGELQGENRRLWRGMRCTNQQVADFVAEASRCESGQCPQKTLDRVLLFMMDQKHVLVRLRPDQESKDMALLRVAQLRDLLHPEQLSPVSRVLVLTLQNNMAGDAAIQLPEKKAEQLVKYMRQELKLAPQTGKVGPFQVTCDQKSQLLEQYSRRSPQDKVAPGEPKPKDPQVVIFVFKVDC
jgi:hypothetical protein